MPAIVPETINPLNLPSLPLADRKRLPNCVAVYFVLENEKVIYVGQASSLVLRWLNHHKFNVLKTRGAEVKLAWLECKSGQLRNFESKLIKHFDPELNRPALNRSDYATRFKKTTDVELDSRVTGVRLPVTISEAIRSLPDSERSAWLRRVISEAAERELDIALSENQLVS